jgi:glucose 1-dehydrogenase
MELQGVAALVTGGAHRVGRAIVMALAEAGCDLVLHYNRSADAAEATAEEARALGREVRLLGADLTDPSLSDEIVAGAGDLAPLRVLVNSAGVFREDSLGGVDVDGWNQSMAVNLRAPVFLTQAFAKALPDGISGSVVNVSDWRTARPYPDHFSYLVAKGGLDSFTVAAAVGLAPDIRVNAVALGAILPPQGKDSAYLKELAQEIPLERVGGTEPVAQAVLFLLRNEFITGEIIRLDGGAHLK